MMKKFTDMMKHALKNEQIYLAVVLSALTIMLCAFIIAVTPEWVWGIVTLILALLLLYEPWKRKPVVPTVRNPGAEDADYRIIATKLVVALKEAAEIGLRISSENSIFRSAGKRVVRRETGTLYVYECDCRGEKIQPETLLDLRRYLNKRLEQNWDAGFEPCIIIVDIRSMENGKIRITATTAGDDELYRRLERDGIFMLGTQDNISTKDSDF